MNNLTSEVIDAHLDLSRLGYALKTKPVVFGGMAMEYYGLRPHGHDIDLIISFEDYEALEAMYPQYRKDCWGDLGLAVGDLELWRSIWKLDHSFFAEGAIEYDKYMVVSVERLLLTKALAINVSEKQKQDTDLVAKHIIGLSQRSDILEYMNAHVASYLASPDGFVYNGQYVEDKE